MSIYIISEPEYRESTWCADIIEGIRHAASKNKISVHYEDFFSNSNSTPSKNDIVAVVAHSPGKINQYIEKTKKISNAHIIVVGAQAHYVNTSSVSTDIDYSVKSTLSYLYNDCNKTSTALYGVNPALYGDLRKLAAFPENGKVYYYRNNLSECFSNLKEDINKYDSFICTNDYVALSLINQLKSCGIYDIRRPFIVSLANTQLSARTTPSITSVLNNEHLLGETAVDIYTIISKNPNVKCINTSIRSKLKPRNTTNNIPVGEQEIRSTDETPVLSPSEFYNDEEVASLIKLEKLLACGDMNDISIISMLAIKKSYEEIAEATSMSVSGIKYRIKNYVEKLELSNNKELKAMISRFFK